MKTKKGGIAEKLGLRCAINPSTVNMRIDYNDIINNPRITKKVSNPRNSGKIFSSALKRW